MKPRTIRTKIALAAGLLSSLVVILFAVISAWRFYHEQIDVFDTDNATPISAQHLAEAREEVEELVMAYLLALPFVAMLAAAGAWWMAGRLTDPLARLAKMAEKMNAKTLHERLPEMAGQDEISRLARMMNGLFARLEKSFVQAGRFAADASHELRTPLMITRGTLEEAIRDNPSGPVTPLLVELLEQNQQITSVTEKLLLLARADAERLIVAYEAVDLSVMIREMTDDMAILAKADGTRFSCNIAREIWVMGDKALLGQMLMNLFENAVKYSSEKGWIFAQLEQRGKDVVFAISNSGQVIPTETQSRLFERFFRVSEARDRKSGGVGLGLSICLEIATAHGGQLELVSSDEKGTIFRLQLPAV